MVFSYWQSREYCDLVTQACYFVFSFKKLSPERYFEKNKFIDKSCARKYEKDLKKEFKSWADEKHFEKVKGILPKNSLHSDCDVLALFAIALMNKKIFLTLIKKSPVDPSLWSPSFLLITLMNRISNNITIVWPDVSETQICYILYIISLLYRWYIIRRPYGARGAMFRWNTILKG